MTVRELLYNVTKILDSRGIENASFEAREIIAFCLGMKKNDLIFQQNEECADSDVKKAREFAQRRLHNDPIQ